MTSVRLTSPSTVRTRGRRIGIASTSLVAIASLGVLAGLTGTASAATSVDLGTAADFGVLGTSGISNTGVTTVEGDIGADNGSITGADAGQANTIVFTDGVNRGPDTVTAQADADAAYLAISAQGNGVVVGTPDLALQTQPLIPGVYSSASTLNVDTPLVLDGQGSYDSVFVFRAGTAINAGTGSTITLVNGAQACNIFWQAGSGVNLLGATFAGNVLADTESITVGAAVTIDGRLLARTAAVTLINDTIFQSPCQTGLVAPPVVVNPPVPSPPVTSPPVSSPPVASPPVTAPPTTATPRRPTYGQVSQVPVGSVDTGDGSTADLLVSSLRW